jgi:NIMA (never in mitosis gene a)-related kinase
MNFRYALKKVKLSELNYRERWNSLNEVRILASIRNPNIIGYKKFLLTETFCTFGKINN